MHIFHNWMYYYPAKGPLYIYAFSTGVGPDWSKRKCSICDKKSDNPNYQVWLDYLQSIHDLVEYNHKHNIRPLLPLMGVME